VYDGIVETVLEVRNASPGSAVVNNNKIGNTLFLAYMMCFIFVCHLTKWLAWYDSLVGVCFDDLGVMS
jgi:hypothetical protein